MGATFDYEESTFEGHGGVQLFRRSWRPANPVAALVNLHGLGDHSGLYAPLAEWLAAENLAVHAPDFRGHGRSPGQRAYVERWDDHLDDLDAFLSWVAVREPRLPVFVLGHSLGGLIALDLAAQRTPRAQGIIAAAPPLGAVGVPPVLMALGRAMARVWPRFSLNVGMDLTGLSRDPAVVETITSDPLFHRRGTARLSVEVPRAIARVHEGARRIEVPLLLLHGTSDRMVPPDGTRSFFARFMKDGADPSGPAAPGAYTAPDRDVTLRLYADAYHALFFDVGRDEVRSDVVRWMRARSARPA